jgi:hypothetical protein
MLHIKPLAGTITDARVDYGYRIYYGILPPADPRWNRQPAKSGI